MVDHQIIFPPKSHIGRGAIRKLEQEIADLAPAHVLLITDPVLVKLGVAEQIAQPLREAGVNITLFSDVTPEPELALAERLVEVTKRTRCDMVVGLGGGSALDLAKVAAVLAVHEGAVADYLNLSGERVITDKGLPKALIPTTAGTGSEVTDIAVLSLGHTKDVIAHRCLLADIAIVDPELTLTVPPRVTAATGMDALTHAIESYLSVNASPVTDGLALHAVKLAGRSLVQAVADGSIISAREDMSAASYMAGLAFFNAGVAGVHALAYPLGGQFHLPHGEANAVLLPHVMERIRGGCADRMKDLLEALGYDVRGIEAEEASVRLVEQLRHFIALTGLPASLQEYGIPESAIPVLAEDAATQTRLLSRSPVKLDYAAIEAIYRSAWK
ncbi:iron-containing alcohol dehydrogenase [Paenibacillus chungangensis]|uniref:Iron-containing alcohol dehydrogenase n=1 Tax=Paenibacillus chungangensis TaxID=696535 RepID=A0ABW3HQW2_9BACL